MGNVPQTPGLQSSTPSIFNTTAVGSNQSAPFDWNSWINSLAASGQAPAGSAQSPWTWGGSTTGGGFDMTGLLNSLGITTPTTQAQGVPQGLSAFGTQASNFGNMWGLGNPLLVPLSLLLANYPTTNVPFSNTPAPGSPTSRGHQGSIPPFVQVPPVQGPGGAAGIPGALPSVGQGPFSAPGGGGGVGGVGGGGGGGGDTGGGGGGGNAPAPTPVQTGPLTISGDKAQMIAAGSPTQFTYVPSGGQVYAGEPGGGG